MAFGRRYGYKTNAGRVLGLALGDVYDTDKVDLLLLGGGANGVRTGVVVVADEATAVANQAWSAEATADVVA